MIAPARVCYDALRMTQTLYRKYRPQVFGDITGQEHIIQTLCAQISRGNSAHAYLFSGTRGTGKTTTARVFAKALNCSTRTEGQAEPCGLCVSCTEITAGRSIDVIELDAATHTGVDTVREHIVEHARTLPTRDRYKIFIIDEVHMLSTSAFNALLKTLEEPPAHVVYILATTELHKIPATVSSRCQRFLFRPLAPARMMEKLRRIAAAEFVVVDDTVLGRIISASGGAMRDAESLLGQLMAMDSSHITDAHADVLLSPRHTHECVHIIEALAAAQPAQALALLDELFERGVDVAQLHDECIAHAHELLLACVTKRLPEFLGVFSDDESALLLTAARGMQPAWLAQCIDRLVQAKQLHKSLAMPLVALHVWIASYAQASDVTKLIAAVPPRVPQKQPERPVERAEGPHAPTADPEHIRNNWDAARAQLSTHMPSLGIMLSAAQLTDVRDGAAHISVPNSLYRDKLSEPTVRRQLEQALTSGSDGVISCVISYAPAAAVVDSPLVGSALATFGGAVVN